MADPLKEKAKLSFTLGTFDEPDPFAARNVPNADLLNALAWQSERTVEQAMSEREAIMSKLEKQAGQLRAAGACDKCVTVVLLSVLGGVPWRASVAGGFMELIPPSASLRRECMAP